MNIAIAKLRLGIIGMEGIRTFTADIVLNGKKVGECREDGNGGCLNIYPVNGGYWKDTVLGEMDEWCKENLPKWGSEFGTTEHETGLEMHLINLVAEIETQKQLARDMKKYICFKAKGDNAKLVAYSKTGWRNFNIEQILNAANGAALMTAKILEIQINGGKILNTNLGKLQHLVK